MKDQLDLIDNQGEPLPASSLRLPAICFKTTINVAKTQLYRPVRFHLIEIEKIFRFIKKKDISEILLRLSHIRGKEAIHADCADAYGYLNLVYSGAPSAQANLAPLRFGWFLLAPANSALCW